jgi:hypothetical protein
VHIFPATIIVIVIATIIAITTVINISIIIMITPWAPNTTTSIILPKDYANFLIHFCSGLAFVRRHVLQLLPMNLIIHFCRHL